MRKHLRPFLVYWCREPDTSRWRWCYTVTYLVMLAICIFTPRRAYFGFVPVAYLLVVWTISSALTYKPVPPADQETTE